MGQGSRVTFRGKPGGDGECFCFVVDRENYQIGAGKEALQSEEEDRQQGFSLSPRGTFWLYMSDIIYNLGFRDKYDHELKITIEIEDATDES